MTGLWEYQASELLGSPTHVGDGLLVGLGDVGGPDDAEFFPKRHVSRPSAFDIASLWTDQASFILPMDMDWQKTPMPPASGESMRTGGVGHLPNRGVGFLEGLGEDAHGLQLAVWRHGSLGSWTMGFDSTQPGTGNL